MPLPAFIRKKNSKIYDKDNGDERTTRSGNKNAYQKLSPESPAPTAVVGRVRFTEAIDDAERNLHESQTSQNDDEDEHALSSAQDYLAAARKAARRDPVTGKRLPPTPARRQDTPAVTVTATSSSPPPPPPPPPLPSQSQQEPPLIAHVPGRPISPSQFQTTQSTLRHLGTRIKSKILPPHSTVGVPTASQSRLYRDHYQQQQQQQMQNQYVHHTYPYTQPHQMEYYAPATSGSAQDVDGGDVAVRGYYEPGFTVRMGMGIRVLEEPEGETHGSSHHDGR
jgi:hypothetical protein